jgi:predicted RNA-binding protein with PUA-like domain
MKSEPDAFSINDLYNKPNQTEHWDAVRNYQPGRATALSLPDITALAA